MLNKKITINKRSKYIGAALLVGTLLVVIAANALHTIRINNRNDDGSKEVLTMLSKMKDSVSDPTLSEVAINEVCNASAPKFSSTDVVSCSQVLKTTYSKVIDESGASTTDQSALLNTINVDHANFIKILQEYDYSNEYQKGSITTYKYKKASTQKFQNNIQDGNGSFYSKKYERFCYVSLIDNEATNTSIDAKNFSVTSRVICNTK